MQLRTRATANHPGPVPDLAIDLVGVLEQLLRLTRQMATAGGLSVAAASLLARLSRDGQQRLTSLASQEGISQPGMTQLVTRLEREGLVRRTPCTDDRRVVFIDVTDEGRALLERRRGERAVALRRLLDRLDAADQAAIANAVDALRALNDLSETAPANTPAGSRHARTFSGDTE